MAVSALAHRRASGRRACNGARSKSIDDIRGVSLRRLGRRVPARDPIAGGRPMSRRSTSERIYQAHRSGTLTRLIGEGELPDRAEALVAAWGAPDGPGLR